MENEQGGGVPETLMLSWLENVKLYVQLDKDGKKAVIVDVASVTAAFTQAEIDISEYRIIKDGEVVLDEFYAMQSVVLSSYVRSLKEWKGA